MTSTTSVRKALPENVESKLVKAIDEAFASESEAWRAAAVIWGRKQEKFERGLRSSKPPVPPKLQNADKAKTVATLKRISDALGLKFEAPKATAPVAPAAPAVAEAPAETPPAAAPKAARPDPKPTGRKPETRGQNRRVASKKPAAAK